MLFERTDFVGLEGYGAPVHVEVIRSTRRRKTVEASVVDGVLRVAIPATMTLQEEQHWVKVMTSKALRSLTAADIDLPAVAARLARLHGLPLPREIVWSNRQQRRWGSCTPTTGRIRISDQVAGFPAWVLDYVVVHEMAHLVESSHSPSFWDLVNRYSLAERARGYLLAKSGGG